MMKGLIKFIALPAIISLSNAAHFSCTHDASQEELLLSEDTQQKVCAMYFDNINGLRGVAPLPDKEQEAQPITGDDEWFNADAGDHRDNSAVWPRETSPECGYYDGLGRRITEDEYQLELDYEHEHEHGVPYPPYLRPEARSLSLRVHSDSQCGGDVVGEVTQPDLCYPVTKGMGISVSSLPRNCEVMGYAGEVCDGEPVEVVPLGSGEVGCYAPRTAIVASRTFGSVLAECEPLVVG